MLSASLGNHPPSQLSFGSNLSHTYEPLSFLGGSLAAGTQQDSSSRTRAGNPHELVNDRAQSDPVRQLHAEQHALYAQQQEQGTPTDAGGAFSRTSGAGEDAGNVNPYHLWAMWGALGFGLVVYLRSAAHRDL